MVRKSSTSETLTYFRRMERLLEASRLLNSTLELTELTEIVLRIVQDEVPMDRCTLFVVDRKRKRLRSFVAQGVERLEITLPIGEGLAGFVAEKGEALDIHDAYQDERFNPDFDIRLEYRTKDVLCLPVFNCQGTLTGVLQLLNRLRPLDKGDKEFLFGMCTYIGLALHNAWIHRELQESRKAEEELRLVRERLAQSEKQSAMGELVAGIIHEMRNPLSVAVAQCSLLREEDGINAAVTSRVGKIEGAIDRALKVAKNFLSFAREDGKDQAPTDLNAIINQTADLLAYDFRVRGINLSLDLDDLPLVTLDAGCIQQVVLNLLKNAQQAAGSDKTAGGSVRVRSKYDSAGNTIRIELSDNGPGMPASVQARIFEPFFTTKAKGEGTGLGLAVSKRIIEQHRGKLSFRSAADNGTTFVIELPVLPYVC